MGDDLYFGAIDHQMNSVIITNGGTTGIVFQESEVTIWGSMRIAASLSVSTIAVPSGNGLGGSVAMIGATIPIYTGILEFLDVDGTRNGSVGFNPVGGPMQYGSDTGAGHRFNGGPVKIGDDQYYFSQYLGNPLLSFDTNDYMIFDRSANVVSISIGGAYSVSISSNYIKFRHGGRECPTNRF
jgi:hypothetical protein